MITHTLHPFVLQIFKHRTQTDLPKACSTSLQIILNSSLLKNFFQSNKLTNDIDQVPK